MKRKFLSVITILIIAALSACGPAPAPTLSVADVQGTAVANAWTVVAVTQAAIPTATETPVPPTSTITLVPLPTIVIAPTQAIVLPTLAIADTPATDPCDQPPPAKPKGTTVQVKFVNKSGGNVNLSFGMSQANSLGECGTYTFVLGTYDSPTVTVLAGCYWGFGWVTGKKPSTAKNIDYLCVTDPALTRSILITSEVIGFP